MKTEDAAENKVYSNSPGQQHAPELPTEFEKFSPGLEPGVTTGGAGNFNMSDLINQGRK
jgi:hypothetical protein